MPRFLQTPTCRSAARPLGRSGVSVVCLPGDVAALDTPQGGAQPALVIRRPTARPARPADEDIAALTRMIEDAKHVTLF